MRQILNMAQQQRKNAMTKTKQTVRPVPASIREDVIKHLAGVLYYMQEADPMDVFDTIKNICEQYSVNSMQYKTFLKHNVEDEIQSRRVQEEYASFCDDGAMANELFSITRWDDECTQHHAMWESWLMDEDVKDEEGLRKDRPDESKIRNLSQAKKERAQDLFDLESFLDNTDADKRAKYQRCVEMYKKYNSMLRAGNSAHSYTGLLDMQNCIINLVEEMGCRKPGNYMGSLDMVAFAASSKQLSVLKNQGFKAKPFTKEEIEKYGDRLNGLTRMTKTFFMAEGMMSKAAQSCLAVCRKTSIRTHVGEWAMHVGNTFDEMREDVNWSEEIKINFYQVQA